MNALLVITSLLACLWLSWSITRQLVLYAIEQRLLDVPNSRSSHRFATPRGGGIAFVIVFIAAVIAMFILRQFSWLAAVGLLGGAAVALVGFLDDRFGLSIRTRLLVHLSASVTAVLCFAGTRSIHGLLPTLILCTMAVIAVICMTWLINLFNFMDGIDGLAGTEAASVATACGLLILLHSGIKVDLILFGVVAVGCAGFLIWNWHPARIFMGDAGSCFLGYTLGALVLFAMERGELALWGPLIMVGVFAIDATMTLLKRMARGEQWYRPHRLHAFQHASAVFGHRDVTIAILCINIFWLFPFALLSVRFPSLGPVFLLAAWMPLLLLAYLFHAGEVLCEGAMPRWRTLLSILRSHTSGPGSPAQQNASVNASERLPLLRGAVLLALAALCSYISLLADYGRTSSVQLWILAASLTIGQWITFLYFGLHRCRWYLVSLEQVPDIVGMSLAGTVFGALTGVMLTRRTGGYLLGIAIELDALLLVVTIVSGHFLAAAVSRNEFADEHDDRVRRVMIYGADSAGVSISSALRRLGPAYHLVGFVDARKAMNGVHLAGGRVLGVGAEVRRLVDVYEIDYVLISTTSLQSVEGRSFVRTCREETVEYRIIPSIRSGMSTPATPATLTREASSVAL